MREDTLLALARLPLLGADDLALLCGLSERGARRALEARIMAGEAGAATHPATHRHLCYLTVSGVTAAARLLATDPADLTACYGLSERALLRRLPALDRLVAGRAVLLRLTLALAPAGGALEECRAYPVRWPFQRAGRRETLVLDGELVLRLAGGVRRAVGYLWDGDAAVPSAALATRLERLAEVRDDPAYVWPFAAGVRPVLLVTAAAARVPRGYHPGLFWTTTETIAASDPLATVWYGTSDPGEHDPARDLRAALDRRGLVSGPTASSWPRPAAISAAPVTADALHRRAERVHAHPTAEPNGLDRSTLPLVLPPRAWPLLRCVGQHPLLDRHDLATVLQRDSIDTWALLRELCRHGLCRAWQSQTGRRAWRYSLTTHGTALLAQAAALTPTAYRRVDGILDDARHPGAHGLAYACANPAHTDGINAVYLAFLAATRARAGTLDWRGEWACTLRYTASDRRGREMIQRLCPDAELRSSGPDGTLHAFLEYDRQTEAAHVLAAKIDHYAAYRASSGDHDVAVLLVTLGPDRADAPLTRAVHIAHEYQAPPLTLYATTASALATHGPWAPIWRSAATQRARLPLALP